MDAAKEPAVAKPRLPPGFRFRPTDEELVVHYLRRRALASPLPAAVDIPDVRILAHDPSDLLPPGWSEQERYFFTCKEAKYVKGRRANRATGAGYWKATGKEKPVAVAVPARGGGGQAQAVLVGMKRSLVFYRGKPPTGSKTDWVMHEYRLAGYSAACSGRRGPRPPTLRRPQRRPGQQRRGGGGRGGRHGGRAGVHRLLRACGCSRGGAARAAAGAATARVVAGGVVEPPHCRQRAAAVSPCRRRHSTGHRRRGGPLPRSPRRSPSPAPATCGRPAGAPGR